MRRYVITERQEPVIKRARSKAPTTKKLVLTESDILSLPAYLRESLPSPKVRPPVVSKPKPVKQEMRPEDVFINSRAAGSKTLNFSRPSKQPLRTFDDRLSATNILLKESDSFSFRDNNFECTIWTTSQDTTRELLHLWDHEEPPEITTVVKVVVTNDPTDKEYLLDTPAGKVCPRCKTNEFIKSELKNRPVTFQSKHWRDRDNFGSYCEVCRCISRGN